jgi:hypothetical protein
MIEVTRRTSARNPLAFEVIIWDGRGETRHQVTIAETMVDRVTGGKHSPERCIEAAFRFLLDREPKESILRHFDVAVISGYFPEFEQELPRYLRQS